MLTTRAGTAAAAVAVLLGAGLAGCTGEGLGSGTGSGAGSDGAPKGSALKALDDLAVKGRAPKTGYARDEFGAAWADTDHNGCGTRDDILRRDLTGTSFRADRGGDCVVVSGTLADPYTGRRIDFTRGRSTVDIDHVVALSDAWQKGAKYWSRDKRRQIANDPLNLLAVDGPTNRGKGDGDAATWLPPDKAFRCPYVARQVAVKKKYGLWVTEAEKAAMAKVLDTCPDEPLPDAGKPAASGGGPDSGGGGGDGDGKEGTAPSPDATYANCAAVREAGAAPLRRGDPGYSRSLDRDGDGVACDT
ncbi:GmrSD restriction endonuclease domain-containing protein [Actinacidiphila glaucinigra]|uniref:GmrSD restriction endonuclease domain-containing protein n=1 Tax=Actinacidiphila glaucinigra TaxID=235986 RepID=UPI0037896CB7